MSMRKLGKGIDNVRKEVYCIAFIMLVLVFCMLWIPKNVYANGNYSDNGSVQYSTISRTSELRDFIDSDGEYTNQDTIDTDWSGNTDLYKLIIDEPGRLIVCPLTDNEGSIRFKIYSNFGLTSLIDQVDDISSDANTEDYGDIHLDAGTYYYRGERWNGYGSATWTVFLGFIPDSGKVNPDENQLGKNTNTNYPHVDTIPISSASDLCEYIDNDGVPSSLDTITTDWTGDTPVYSFTLNKPGKLVEATLAIDEGIDFQLYSNSSLTSLIGSNHSINSSRDKYYVYSLDAGNYYYIGSRWNGYGETPVAVFLGFIPEDDNVAFDISNCTLNKTKVEDVDLTIDNVTSVDDFVSKANTDAVSKVENSIETAWTGSSPVYKITVSESGVLLYYAKDDVGESNVHFYSDSHMRSLLYSGNIGSGFPDNPVQIYLDAGDYYFYVSRWNGYGIPLEITSYLGFIPTSEIISIDSINDFVVTVKYNNPDYNPIALNGTARIVEGRVAAKYIDNSEFWNEDTMENAFDTDTVSVEHEGWYTIRVSKNGYPSFMLPIYIGNQDENIEMTEKDDNDKQDVAENKVSDTETESETMSLEEQNKLLKEILEENGIDADKYMGG